MEVKLLSPSWEHREQCIELLKEWKESGERNSSGNAAALSLYTKPNTFTE